MAFDWSERFPEYVSAAARRRRAERARDGLARGGIVPDPVVVEGRELATTFWGKAWCDHLESLADLATRLPRGRAYARGGAVVHLELAPGVVRAFVSGTELYEAEVRVRPLAAARWAAVRRACAGRIASVVELLSGRLASGVMGVLCDRERGVFPAADELELRCSCPDRARLCKHLAAVLYGVGARLDRAPELLFTLRGVELSELVAEAGQAESLAASPAGSALLADDTLAEIFGIELELTPRSRERPRSRREPREARPRKPGARSRSRRSLR